MKAYYGDDGKIRLFRPVENFARMNNSATRVCLPTFDPEELRLCLHKFVEIEKDWVPQAEGCSLYIRPTMIGTEVCGCIPSYTLLNTKYCTRQSWKLNDSFEICLFHIPIILCIFLIRVMRLPIQYM